MGRKLKFSGYSDDLFYIEGTIGDEPDEVGCFDSDCVIKLWDNETNSGMFVIGRYSVVNNGCWSIAISQIDEDMLIPNWEMSWSSEDYTTELIIDVPGSCQVSHFLEDK